ncbi:hypothetical protein HPP92_014247 [Vanilla planifolia]|uniref:Uncharacterized protein n=1 Tax=Vanilla planifolia TaxID=51239 RepID=A0A835QJN5_VANPL|nr:hypothetical protein HPP92_014247 [Vanilla planifolia]
MHQPTLLALNVDESNYDKVVQSFHPPMIHVYLNDKLQSRHTQISSIGVQIVWKRASVRAWGDKSRHIHSQKEVGKSDPSCWENRRITMTARKADALCDGRPKQAEDYENEAATDRVSSLPSISRKR